MLIMRKKILFLGVGFWLVYLLQGCAEQPVTAFPAAAGSTTPEAGPALQAGVYRTVLRILPGNAFNYEIWHLELKESGRYSIILNDNPLFEGDYSANANDLVFSDDRGPLTCSNPGEPVKVGIYKWAYVGQALVLNEIEDDCYLRKRVLTLKLLQVQQPGQ